MNEAPAFGERADRNATDNAPIPGLVSAFRFELDGTPHELAIDKPVNRPTQGWMWLHFNLADGRACRFLQAAGYFTQAANQLLTDTEEHQQLHTKNACLYGIFADLVCGLDGITEEIGFLHFATTDTLLVSGRRHSLNAVDATRRLLRNGTRVASPPALIELILEQMVDAVDHYSERLARDIDRIEEQVLADDLGNGRQLIGRIRRTTVRLHRQLANQRALMQRFELDLDPSSPFGPKLATARLSQRLDWLDAKIVALRDRAQLLQEELSTKTAEQTNRNLHLLAVVTTIFMPATLIAGIFGMNVGDLPFAGPHGFWWSMLLLIGASAIVYWMLKRSGILRR